MDKHRRDGRFLLIIAYRTQNRCYALGFRFTLPSFPPVFGGKSSNAQGPFGNLLLAAHRYDCFRGIRIK